MHQASIHEAKTHLSRLLRRANDGEDVVITRSGQPVARLVPMAKDRPVFGVDEGRFVVPDDFNDPLDEELQGPIFNRNPNILGGTPVFPGTRVPIRILFEHLEAGDQLVDFLDNYPTVSHEQVVGLLKRANAALIGKQHETAA